MISCHLTKYGKLEFHLWHFEGEETKAAIIFKDTTKINSKYHATIMLF